MCVYDQNYTLVIVTEPKKKNSQSIWPERITVNLSFKYTKPFLPGSKQCWRTNFKICARVLLCVYDQNYNIVIIVTQQKKEFVIHLA